MHHILYISFLELGFLKPRKSQTGSVKHTFSSEFGSAGHRLMFQAVPVWLVNDDFLCHRSRRERESVEDWSNLFVAMPPTVVVQKPSEPKTR
jgi:hypothetical protein